MAAARRAAPGPHWGWHQLADPAARRLVAAAGVRPGDLVLDIGAGTGALTARLVGAGARVIAVELHPRRAEQLRARFSRPPVTVIQVDAADLRLPRRPFRVVANPPFGISMAVVRRLLSPGSRLVSADLVVPRYVARRLLSPGSRLVSADLVVPRYVARRWTDARAPGFGRWSATFQTTIVAQLPRSAFRPQPPGATAVLRISRRA